MTMPEPVLLQSASILIELWKRCPDADKSEQAQISALFHIHKLLVRDWSVPDIVAYMSYTEDFSPDLEEGLALNLMAAISAKYPTLSEVAK